MGRATTDELNAPLSGLSPKERASEIPLTLSRSVVMHCRKSATLFRDDARASVARGCMSWGQEGLLLVMPPLIQTEISGDQQRCHRRGFDSQDAHMCWIGPSRRRANRGLTESGGERLDIGPSRR